MIGETLSHFKIQDKLGQGGMGIVYRAMDLNLDRQVAIKVLAPEAQYDEGSIGRFLREARTASKLQHQAITTIYEFGVKDDQRYLVMEYIQGRTLRDMLRDGPLSLRQSLEIAMQVAEALVVADEAGIIHRDIKPDNIMVTGRGKVKILDFGLAKMKERTGHLSVQNFHTETGQVLGTISYMSPEQAMGKDLDTRTDIYSLGVVLFEMVTGALPFTGNSPNIVLARILSEPAPSPAALNPDIPAPLVKLIGRCMQKDCDRRYRTAATLLADLRSLQERGDTGDEGAAAEQEIGERPPDDSLPAGSSDEPGAAAASVSEDDAAGGPAVATAVETGALAGVAAQSARPSGAAAVTSVRREELAFAVKSLRWLLVSAITFYMLACLTLFPLPLASPDLVKQASVFYFLHLVVEPSLLLIIELFGVSLTWGTMDFRLVGLAFAAYLLKNVAADQLVRLESWIREPLLRPDKPAIQPLAVAPAASRKGTRMSLLRDYAAAKRLLGEVKKEMAFLSLDIAGAATMKFGEEKMAIEQAFAAYRRMVEGIIREYRPYKLAWTADGFMSCFPSVDDAVAAARGVLLALDSFNKGGHYLRSPFRLRCGINLGQVLLPHDKPLEFLSDEVIDVAGHLQKNAEPDTIWIAGEAYFRLLDRQGFARLPAPVDHHDVFSWRKP